MMEQIRRGDAISSSDDFASKVAFDKTASDYAKFRAGFPEEFFQRLAQFGIGQLDQSVLDVGTGTGTVARGLARQGCRVVGLDPSEKLMAQALQLDKLAGVSVDYHTGSAESLPFNDGSFDVLTAGQCWHWFNRPKAAAESLRVLRPGGLLVIAHFDWIPLPSNIVECTEALILKHNPSWSMAGGNGLYPQWLSDVYVAGFREIETFSFDTCVAYSHEAWRGRIRASAGVAASLSEDKVQIFDQEHADVLSEKFPSDPLLIEHRVWTLVSRKP